MADELDKNPAKTAEHNQAQYIQQQLARQRAQADVTYNQQVQAQRAQAPSALKEGSFEAQQVRQQAAQDAQSAYFAGGFQRVGQSKDQYAAARMQAIQSGKFDYGSMRSAFYSPPATFVTPKGVRVERPATPTAAEPTPPTFTSPATFTSPTLHLSSKELARTNALRQSQGLPPLETIANVQVVKGTQSQPVSFAAIQKPKATPTVSISQNELNITNAMRQSQGLPPLQQIVKVNVVKGTQSQPLTSRESEVSSFLKIPFVGQKTTTSTVPSTTILDPLQFLVGGFGGIAKAGVSFVGGLIRSEGKTIIKEGSKDIGLVVKPTEDYVKAALFEKQAARLPPPGSIKPTPPPKVPSFPSGGGTPYKETAINLGMGLGKVVSKEGGGGLATDLTKPPTGPSTSEVDKYMQSRLRQFEDIAKAKGYVITPTEKGIKAVPKESLKETSAGKGLVQLVKQEQKPQTFTQKAVYLGKTELKAVPKTEVKTQAQLKTEQYLKDLQKARTKQVLKTEQEIGLVYVRPTKTTQTFAQPTKQKQRQVPAILPQTKQTEVPAIIPTFTIPPKLKQPPIQKQPPALKQPPFLVSPPTTKTPPPKTPPPKLLTPTPPPNIPSEPPTTKRLPPGFPGLASGTPGALGKVSKFGARKGFIGNVPITGIVGIYKRSEITYGSTAEKLASKGTKTNKNKFSSLSTKKKMKL